MGTAMRRVALFLVLPLVLAAEDHWVKFTSGPYEVYTDAGARAGQETMVRFEEFRHAVGEIVGEQDLKTPQPVRILLFKNAAGWATPEPVAPGRDCYAIILNEKSPVPPAVYIALTRLFLNSNTNRMPPDFEHGLLEFFSTFESKGVRITVGAPPPQPDLDWARIHMLVVDPQYFGRIKVLLYNLRQGVDEDTAFRNALGKSAADIEAQAKQHLAAGNFQTGTISGLPMAADDRDLPQRPVSDADARLARADTLAGTEAQAVYQSLIKDNVKVAAADEGLGLLALRAHNNAGALRYFAAGIQAGSSSARCYIEYARLEPDNQKATEALLKAAGINPKLDEPFALLAARDTDPQKRLAHWKAAAERNPRNPAYWKALAECYLAEHNYSGAADAWTHGEQAATDPAQRAAMLKARLAIEQQRLDYEAAERQRQAEEEAQETEKLKQQALTHVHELEAKYNGGSSAHTASSTAPVPWWQGPKPSGKIHGVLRQVDCLGKQARLAVEGDDHKTVRLLVTDPSSIAITGGDEHAFTCGKQAPREVTIEYFPKVNAHTATAGEVATIQFQ